MPDTHDQPFARYSAEVQTYLRHLTCAQRASVAEELAAHLADAAAEQQRDASDPALQRAVIIQLGSADALGRAMAQAYHPHGWPFAWYQVVIFALLHGVGWAIGLIESGLYRDTNEPQLAFGGALAAALGGFALPTVLRRGRGVVVWLLATVPLWLGCWLQLLRTNWDMQATEGQYELALLGPLTLTLLALGVTQWLVLRRYTTLAWLWIITPFCALYLAFALSVIVRLPFALAGGIGQQFQTLQEIVVGLSLGSSYGLLTALVLKGILHAGGQPTSARVT